MMPTPTPPAPRPGPFQLLRHHMHALPILNHILDRMQLVPITAGYLPPRDARVRIDPALVVAVLVRNALCGHRPG
jgi:hypothetical protein